MTGAAAWPARPGPAGARARDGTALALFAWIVLFLFMLSNPLEFVVKGIVPGQATLSDPTTARAIYSNVKLQMGVKAAVLGAFAVLVPGRIGLVPVVVARTAPLALFLLFAAASLGWSDTPGNSFTDLVYLSTALVAGTALVLRLGTGAIARAYAWAGVVIGGMSLVMVVAFPAYGIHQPSEAFAGDLAGAWRGVYLQKNVLGQVMATFFVVYVLRGRELFGARKWQVAAAALALLEVLGSRSASGLLMLFLCGLAAFVLFVLDGVPRLLALLLLPIAGVIGATLTGAVLEALGRGADLSGRRDIWAAALRVLSERPWFGYGYGSATMGGLVTYVISRFKAQNTHNGYLDLALSTGLVGSALFAAAVLLALVRAARALRAGGEAALLAATLGTFTVGWLIAAMSEVALRPNTPMGALGLCGLVALCTLAPAAPPARAVAA